MKRTDSFVGYTGETTDELLRYSATGQHDSLVRAFEEGLQRKALRRGEDALNQEERIVLAVRALDREVNNGGYHQFFSNSSRKFTHQIVRSLTRIGCRRTANITQRAIDALGCDQELDRCDQLFYGTPQGIAKRLYAFIKANRRRIRL